MTGTIKAKRVSWASKPGDCWICGYGPIGHYLSVFFIRHPYAIYEQTFANTEELLEEYGPCPNRRLEK